MEYQINLVVVHRGGPRLASFVELGIWDYCFNFFDSFPEIHVDAIENRLFDNHIHVNVSFPAESIIGDSLLPHCSLHCLLDIIVSYSAVRLDK